MSTSTPPELRPDVESALLRKDDLRPLSGFAYLGTFLQGGLRHIDVGVDHWERGEHPEGFTVAYVRCVCGTAICLAIGEYPLTCRCARAFFFDGTSVWALNSPAIRASA